MICHAPPAMPILFGAPRLVLLEPRKWTQRRVSVRFLDGEDWQRQQVADIIDGPAGWNSACGLQFIFDQSEQAPIRVTFAVGASWSYPGSYAAEVPPPFPTMQLGWSPLDVDGGDIRRVALHEFGHALGFEHEHANPSARIAWDKEAVYVYYQRVAGWDRETVDAQVLAQLDPAVLEYSEWDRDSVMGYTLSADLMIDGVEIRGGEQLSYIDRVMAATWYGLPAKRWHRLWIPQVTK